MECLNLGESKIRLILTKEEAESRGVLSDSSSDSAEKRKKYRRILDEVKSLFGFDVGRERALVQIYPTKDGGAELFVTRLSGAARGVGDLSPRSDRFEVVSSKRMYYIFERFDELIGATRAIDPSLTEDSCVYRLESGEYCLSFLDKDECEALGLCRILEFGRRFPAADLYGLSEHARLVIGADAVEILSSL